MQGSTVGIRFRPGEHFERNAGQARDKAAHNLALHRRLGGNHSRMVHSSPNSLIAAMRAMIEQDR